MGANRESGDGGRRRRAKRGGVGGGAGGAYRSWTSRRSIKGPRDLGFTFSDADLASIVPGLRHKRSEENHRAMASPPPPRRRGSRQLQRRRSLARGRRRPSSSTSRHKGKPAENRRTRRQEAGRLADASRFGREGARRLREAKARS